MGHVESHFDPLGDSVSIDDDRFTVCANQTICLETVLDAPDGTPRRQGSSGCLFRSIWREC
jgi:hypothetical protein